MGAAFGASLRWIIGVKLNPLFPEIPPGTLIANLSGSYIIGIAIAYIATNPGLPAEWRLLIITGFCGSLTTFSTFSSEIIPLLQQGRLTYAAGSIALHVAGSILMTFLGITSWNLIKS